MGATVVNTSLTVSAWTKAKPADFKGKDLENALKGAEGLDAKKIATAGETAHGAETQDLRNRDVHYGVGS